MEESREESFCRHGVPPSSKCLLAYNNLSFLPTTTTGSHRPDEFQDPGWGPLAEPLLGELAVSIVRRSCLAALSGPAPLPTSSAERAKPSCCPELQVPRVPSPAPFADSSHSRLQVGRQVDKRHPNIRGPTGEGPPASLE